MDNPTIKTLLALAYKCSPGDLSVIEVALGKHGMAQMTTGPDSANFHFWSACAVAGLMARLPDLDVPGAEGSWAAPVFTITDLGRQELPYLWDLITQHYDPRSYHMSKLYNDVCWPFVEQFYKAVDAGRGQDDDIETLIAKTLTRLISKRYAQEKHEDKLMFIHARTRQMLMSRNGD